MPNDDQKQQSTRNRPSAPKAARLRAPLTPQSDASGPETTALQPRQSDQSTRDLTATGRTRGTRRLDTVQHNAVDPQPIVFGIQVEEKLVIQPPPRPQRIRRPGQMWQSLTARVLIPVLTLLFGIAIGLSGLYWYGSQLNGNAAPARTATSGDIVVAVDKTVITQIVTQNMTKAGLPGTIKKCVSQYTK